MQKVSHTNLTRKTTNQGGVFFVKNVRFPVYKKSPHNRDLFLDISISAIEFRNNPNHP
jgi:hypothetical protein